MSWNTNGRKHSWNQITLDEAEDEEWRRIFMTNIATLLASMFPWCCELVLRLYIFKCFLSSTLSMQFLRIAVLCDTNKILMQTVCCYDTKLLQNWFQNGHQIMPGTCTHWLWFKQPKQGNEWININLKFLYTRREMSLHPSFHLYILRFEYTE